MNQKFAKLVFMGVHLSRRSVGEGGFVAGMITNHDSLVTSP